MNKQMNKYQNSFFSNENRFKKHLSSYDKKSVHFKIPLLFSCILLLLAISSIVYKLSFASIKNSFMSIAVIEIITIAFPLIMYLKFTKSDFSYSSISGFSADKLIIIFLSSFAMIFGSIALTIALSKLGILRESASVYNNFEFPTMPNRLAPMLFASFAFALIPAVCEEILCRELLFNEYKRFGTITAIIVSSFFFSILHFSLEKFPVYFFCGLMLGFLRAMTNSVYASMLAHFIYNMFVLMYQQFFGALSEQFSEFTIIFFISLGLCILTLFFIFGEVDRQYHSYARKNVYIKRSYTPISLPLIKDTSKMLFTSPSFILCVLLYIVFSIFI